MKIPLDLKAVLRGPALKSQTLDRCPHGCYIPAGQTIARDRDGVVYCTGCQAEQGFIERRTADSLLYREWPACDRRKPKERVSADFGIAPAEPSSIEFRLSAPDIEMPVVAAVFEAEPFGDVDGYDTRCLEDFPITEAARKSFRVLKSRHHGTITPQPYLVAINIEESFKKYQVVFNFKKLFAEFMEASFPVDPRPGVAGEDYIETQPVVEPQPFVFPRHRSWPRWTAPSFVDVWRKLKPGEMPNVILDHSQPECAKPFTNFCPDCFTRSKVTGEKFYGLYVPQIHACQERADA